MRDLLYINGELVDLSPKTVIAVTIKAFEIGLIKTRNISHTNSIKLPSTDNNNRIFENANLSKSNTSLPYQLLSARLILKGIEIPSIKNCIVEEFDDEYIITLYEDGVDFLGLIETKLLSDLDYLSNSGWNATDIDTARTATTGATAPVLNYGKFNGTTVSVNSDFYLPSYFYHEIIKDIIQNAGYTHSGSIYSDTDLTELVIPYSREEFKYAPRFQTERTFEATNTSPQVITGLLLTDVVVTVDNVISDPIGWFDTGISSWVIPDFSTFGFIGKRNLTAIVTLTFPATNLIGDIITLKMLNTGVFGDTVLDSVNYEITANPETVTLTLQAEDEFQDLDSVDIRVVTFLGNIDVTIDSVVFRGYVKNEPYVNLFFHNYLLPDVSQSEVFKDFAVRFGVVFKFRFGVMYAKTIEEIINDKANAVDWTLKRVRKNDKIKFSNNDYAQNNYFIYDQDDDVSEDLGRGNLEIASNTIEEEKNIFDSVFLNTESSPVSPNGSINMATIPIFDSTSTTVADFIREPGIRLLTLRSKGTDEPNVTFNATARSDYKVAYFVDSLQAKDTGFQYFLDAKYAGLKRSLDKTKVIPREYNLTSLDIANLDLFLPVYDNGEYFIINEVKNFVSGEITTVELLKVL